MSTNWLTQLLPGASALFIFPGLSGQQKFPWSISNWKKIEGILPSNAAHKKGPKKCLSNDWISKWTNLSIVKNRHIYVENDPALLGRHDL